MNRFFITLICICGFLTSGFSQDASSITLSTPQEIKEDIAVVPCENKDRLEGVRQLFISKGAAESDVAVKDFKHVKNVVIEKKGRTNETVIIGAHYDEAGGGCGAIDNWSGIVIIANLYRTISVMDTEKTYKFVAFGKEEKGLVGSKAMAKAIPKDERSNYCAMVNLDSFGMAYPKIMKRVSSPSLTALAKETAVAMNIPFSVAKIRGASSDSASFKKKKIPSITVHGMSDKWRLYLHSSRDQVENVNHASVYHGYRFTLRFVTAIDAKACDAFRKKS